MNNDLFIRCKKNDSKAQRALYDLYKARLMGLCRRYARDRDDAQDMLQETFIKIFSKISQVTTVEAFEGWMKTIAVNTAIDHYSRRKRHDFVDTSAPGFDVADANYELILDNLTDEFLITIVNDLPEGCRVVFNLITIEGYSHMDVAKMIGISENTSRSQLHYAKQLLKEKLNRLGIKRYEKYA